MPGRSRGRRDGAPISRRTTFASVTGTPELPSQFLKAMKVKEGLLRRQSRSIVPKDRPRLKGEMDLGNAGAWRFKRERRLQNSAARSSLGMATRGTKSKKSFCDSCASCGEPAWLTRSHPSLKTDKDKDAGGTPALPGVLSRQHGGRCPAGDFSRIRRAPCPPFELEKPLVLAYSFRLPVASGPPFGSGNRPAPGRKVFPPGTDREPRSRRPAGQQQFGAELH